MICVARAATRAAAVFAAVFAVACSSGDGTSTPNAAPEDARRIAVEVGASGYEPATVEVDANEPVVLVFTRVTDDGCGQEVVIADLDIRHPLPLHEPVEVALTATEAGRIRFSCGMDMYDGAIVVR